MLSLDGNIATSDIRPVYEIAYSTTALKSLRRLPANWRMRIKDKVSAVAGAPYGQHPQVKRLAGRADFRLRVGDWRVLYRLDAATRTLLVLDVLKREEAYR